MVVVADASALDRRKGSQRWLTMIGHYREPAVLQWAAPTMEVHLGRCRDAGTCLSDNSLR